MHKIFILIPTRSQKKTQKRKNTCGDRIDTRIFQKRNESTMNINSNIINAGIKTALCMKWDHDSTTFPHILRSQCIFSTIFHNMNSLEPLPSDIKNVTRKKVCLLNPNYPI